MRDHEQKTHKEGTPASDRSIPRGTDEHAEPDQSRRDASRAKPERPETPRPSDTRDDR